MENVDPLAFARPEGNQRKPSLVTQMGLRRANVGGVVALVVIRLANVRVFFKFAGVVGLGKEVFEEDRVRMPIGLRFFIERRRSREG